MYIYPEPTKYHVESAVKFLRGRFPDFAGTDLFLTLTEDYDFLESLPCHEFYVHLCLNVARKLLRQPTEEFDPEDYGYPVDFDPCDEIAIYADREEAERIRQEKLLAQQKRTATMKKNKEMRNLGFCISVHFDKDIDNHSGLKEAYLTKNKRLSSHSCKNIFLAPTEQAALNFLETVKKKPGARYIIGSMSVSR